MFCIENEEWDWQCWRMKASFIEKGFYIIIAANVNKVIKEKN